MASCNFQKATSTLCMCWPHTPHVLGGSGCEAFTRPICLLGKHWLARVSWSALYSQPVGGRGGGGGYEYCPASQDLDLDRGIDVADCPNLRR